MATKSSKDTPPAEPVGVGTSDETVGTDPVPTIAAPIEVEWVEPPRVWTPEELRRGALAEDSPLWGPAATGSAQEAPAGPGAPSGPADTTESNGGAQDA